MGLGTHRQKRNSLLFVSNKDPKLAFLMETKAEKEVLEKFHRRIQFAHMFFVSRQIEVVVWPCFGRMRL